MKGLDMDRMKEIIGDDLVTARVARLMFHTMKDTNKDKDAISGLRANARFLQQNGLKKLTRIEDALVDLKCEVPRYVAADEDEVEMISRIDSILNWIDEFREEVIADVADEMMEDLLTINHNVKYRDRVLDELELSAKG